MPKSSTYPNIKALIISALVVISLTACSSGTQNNQSSSDSTSPSNSQTTEAPDPNAPPVATAPATSSVGEVPQPEEVKFQESATDVSSGYIDTVNDSANPKQTIAKTQPIIIAGWAVSRDQKQPADLVLITIKDNKSIISTAKVDGERQDVANTLKNPSIAMSGWNVEIDPATLPSETVELQAWAYDTETKEAYPLNNTTEITTK